MRKKLTITIDEEGYASLSTMVEEHDISHLIESLIRLHVIGDDQNSDRRQTTASIVDMLTMPEAADIDFAPTGVGTINPWVHAASI